MEQQLPPSAGTPAVRPKNWLVESILVTVFCCLPFGIAGIVFASQVNSRFEAGQYEEALKASKDAAKWTKIGFVVGIAWLVVCAIFWGGTLIATLNMNH